MPLFMTETKLTEESLRSLARRPSNRPEAVAKVIEAHGGHLHHFYWVFGEVDIILISEFPDHESAMASLFSLSSGGAVARHKTTVMLTNEQAMDAMTRASITKTDYRSPREEWEGWQDEGGEG